MNIFDFLTQDEIDDLPEDDAESAFTSFVRIAQRRLSEQTARWSGDDPDECRQREDARYGFMNVVVAAGKKFCIEPFATLEVPRLDRFNYEVHRQFMADLDHYLTQLLLNNSTRRKKDSVFIPSDTKASIRAYVHHLREVIDRADIEDTRREKLLHKLSEFEAELEKRRLSLASVALFSIAIIGAPGGVWASGEVASKLVSNILNAVAEAKAREDQNRLLPPSEHLPAITGPRDERTARRVARESFQADLDDEIPF